MTHEFVESSGTTRTCRNCGCTMYFGSAVTRGGPKYDRWMPRKREWTANGWTDYPPACVPGRDVPDWLAKKGGDR